MEKSPTLRDLKEALINNNPTPIVRLQFNRGGNYFYKEFIEGCIKELQMKSLLAESGIDDSPLSPCQILAGALLVESAGYEIKKDEKNDRPA